MALFAGSDVDTTPGWLRNHWLLAALVVSFHADLVTALVMGGRRLGDVLEKTELPAPGPTQVVIDLGRFLHVWWPLALLPLIAGPLLLAWRCRERGALWLQVWLLALIVLFIGICVAILLPIKTIATTPMP